MPSTLSALACGGVQPSLDSDVCGFGLGTHYTCAACYELIQTTWIGLLAQRASS